MAAKGANAARTNKALRVLCSSDTMVIRGDIAAFGRGVIIFQESENNLHKACLLREID